MTDPRKHPLCRGYVVGLDTTLIGSLMNALDWERGEFVVSYEKSPTESAPVVCVYNGGDRDWCTSSTGKFTCPFCQDVGAPRMTNPLVQAVKHEFTLADTSNMPGWFGTRRVHCKDGHDHVLGLFIAW